MKAKIYTKTGDQGQTALVSGRRVSKSDPRLDAYGTVDELNSAIGLAIALMAGGSTAEAGILRQVQNELFNLGSRLACDDAKILAKLPEVTEASIQEMEKHMDAWEAALPALTNFILPGGTPAAAALHVARTVCRRAERHTAGLDAEKICVVYLNRLSDFLFTMARKVNADAGSKDVVWKK